MKKVAVFLTLVLVVFGLVSSLSAEATDTDYNINILLPGWYQLQTGNPEGPWLLPGMPLAAIGTYLLLAPSSDQSAATLVPGIYASDSKAIGSLLSQIGNTLWIYSTYDALRDQLGSSNGNLNLAQVLSAPFDPEVVSDPRVWGIVAMGTVVATATQLKTWAVVRESGAEVPGLPVTSAFQWALTLPAAATAGYTEELLFRGLLQPTFEVKGWKPNDAIFATGLIFGLVHLMNFVSTPPKSERDWITAGSQVAGAMLFGFYNGWQALDGANGLRRAIATHFWWNALAVASNQLAAVNSHNGDWSLMFTPTSVQASTRY